MPPRWEGTGCKLRLAATFLAEWGCEEGEAWEIKKRTGRQEDSAASIRTRSNMEKGCRQKKDQTGRRVDNGKVKGGNRDI